MSEKHKEEKERTYFLLDFELCCEFSDFGLGHFHCVTLLRWSTDRDNVWVQNMIIRVLRDGSAFPLVDRLNTGAVDMRSSHTG